MKEKMTTTPSTPVKKDSKATTNFQQDDSYPEWLRVDQFNGKTWYLVVAAAAAGGSPSYFGGFPTRKAAEEMWYMVRTKVEDAEMELRQDCRDLAYSQGKSCTV